MSLSAQTISYYPFPESDAYWSQSMSWIQGRCDVTIDASIYFGGDTLIGSTIYHKLIRSGYGYSTMCGGNGYFYDNPYAFIRQDISLRQVYMLDNSMSEVLLYDFNLQIGDTLDSSKVAWAPTHQTFIVSSIDSILINGQYRKRYNYQTSCPLADSSIIEGIGSTFGLLAPPADCFESFSLLNCFSQDGNTLYPDNSTTCSLISGQTELLFKSSRALISPNPFHISAKVISNESNADFLIFNSTGHLLRKERIEDRYYILERRGLPNGIYMYQIIKNNLITDQGRFLIE